MTTSEQAATSGGPVAQVPVALGGEGVVYNLSPAAGARLHLTGPVLAGIFLGQITRWNDPALTALNLGIALPNADHGHAPLRRQRHHLHLQQLPIQHRPGLGRQSRHRHGAQLAGRGRPPRRRGGGAGGSPSRRPGRS
jgi:hypothetical protein